MASILVICEIKDCHTKGLRHEIDGAWHALCRRHYIMMRDGLSDNEADTGVVKWSESEWRHLLFLGYLLKTGRIEGHPADLAVAVGG